MRNIFKLRIVFALVLLNFSNIFAAGDFDADAYVNIAFLIFLGFLALITFVFLIGHSKSGSEEKAMLATILHKINDAKPVEKEEEILFDHEFDGIRELDNNLPPWWKALFYITIIWSAAYLVYYHVFGSGPSSAEEYANEVRQAEIAIAAYTKDNVLINLSNVTLLTDAGALSKGKIIYDKNCATCHGNYGEGLVGPNLIDPNWIHGGGIKDVYKVVEQGVVEKGMISWKSLLSGKEMQEVSSYVINMKNNEVPAGVVLKPAQGDIIVEPESE
ncbi:MAG: c-type cytochrome [Ignavibacteriaceae bacterium]|nr:c-type cytochrome [Ignavibacteriaceae bacterium]